MAIVNTLQKCLESPYLFRDDAAPARVPALLKLADDRLAAALAIQGLEKHDPADVGALAYESMFASLRALVYVKGYREAGLKCLVLAAEQLYVRTDLLEADHLQAFEQAQGQKLPPVEAIEAARIFGRKVRELVGK